MSLKTLIWIKKQSKQGLKKVKNFKKVHSLCRDNTSKPYEKLIEITQDLNKTKAFSKKYLISIFQCYFKIFINVIKNAWFTRSEQSQKLINCQQVFYLLVSHINNLLMVT